jgi:hypothetical protein
MQPVQCRVSDELYGGRSLRRSDRPWLLEQKYQELQWL